MMKDNHQAGDVSFSTLRPLCTEGVLDKSSFKYDFNAEYSPMKPYLSSCRLKQYGKSETIQCFDQLSNKLGTVRDSGDNDYGEIHVAFIGDSRIRQFYLQFLIDNHYRDHIVFVQMFPWQNVSRPLLGDGRHTDMSELIPLLDNAVRVSYYWQPLLYDNNVTDNIISHWANSKSSDSLPDFILIGITVHHMLEQLERDQVYFERTLRVFSPILDRLSRRMMMRERGQFGGGGIVWMNQFPVTDFFKNECDSKCKIHSENIEHYNSLARRILSNTAVRVWDSLDLIMADYIQSCGRNFRENPQYPFQKFYGCGDYLHPGYVAINEATQLLLNDICNRVFPPDVY